MRLRAPLGGSARFLSPAPAPGAAIGVAVAVDRDGVAIASVPILLNQASIAYNDIAFAAILVAAAVIAAKADDRVSWSAVGFMVGAAILIKPLAVLFVPALTVMVWRRRTVGRSVLAGTASGGMTMGIGAVYNYLVLRTALPGPSGVEIRRFRDAPLATGRIPLLTDVLLTPFIPLFCGVVGQREPYGGRTGLVFLVFVPATIVWILLRRTLDGWAGSQLLAPLALAMAVATVFPRTRFHGVTWVLLAVLLSTVPWISRNRLARVVLVLCVVGGVADSTRILLRPW